MARHLALGNAGYRSWGCIPKEPPRVRRMRWRDERLPRAAGPLLPFGNGRSYGDSCLNYGGLLIDTRGLNRFISFDTVQGVLRCEAGVLLSDILERVVPHGWFLPVTPGTQFVTVGGAIANDVHGKNHHRSGSFGHHIRRFELLRSDGGRLVCSPAENSDWFAATIGGLGLTGLILWAEITLKAVQGPLIEAQTIRFTRLQEFFELSRESHDRYEYTVAWIDGFASGKALGRGLFMRGNHAPGAAHPARGRQRKVGIPLTPPFSLVQPPLVRAFNSLYYHKPLWGGRTGHYEPFFYPLDGIGQWNRLFGRRGFFQYQCVLPLDAGFEATAELLRRIARAGAASFLSVLKVFGDQPPAGWLSFPRPGVTLAMDLPNRGQATLKLLEELDEITSAAGGAVYPAKDGRMSSAAFHRGFPNWPRLEKYRDPVFCSAFWQRVTERLA
ncbi:MAG: FAD-binding oxidoreductase [Nitrococcus sp.]|nr:FAD-binding oxidoreductase [Nitrococcus sp.]